MLSGAIRLNVDGIEALAETQNLPHVINQIDLAADRLTSFMRQHGWALPDGKDVPLLREVDWYLRGFVREAYLAFVETKKEAQGNGDNPADWEIEGYATDDRLVEIVATGIQGHPKHIKLQILLHII